MPTVFKGIGTWYYGKANVHVRRGQCEFCNNVTDLKSYDTTLFFVVFMTPLFPVKAVHIRDQCAVCKRHRVMKLKAWEALADKTISEALAAYAAAPRDSAKAEEAIRATTAFRAEDAFFQLAPTVRQNQRGDGKVLVLLGDSYSFFGRTQEAEGCYGDALRLGDSADARQALETMVDRSPAGSAIRGKSSGQPILPRLVGPAVLAGVMLLFAWGSMHMAEHRTVYVVSGVDREYEVLINGQRLRLGPHGQSTVELPEGDVKVEFPGPAVRLAPHQYEFHTPFWTRPFLNRTFILNPDRTAIIYTQTTEYSVNPGVGAKPDVQILLGDGAYMVAGMDYKFEEFPDKITVESKGTAPIEKKRVVYFQKMAPKAAWSLVLGKFGPQQAAAYARACAVADPSQMEMLTIAMAMLPLEDTLTMLRGKLEERPVLIEWHRAYQSLMEQQHPEQDLYPQYKAMLEKEPGNPTLIYLLGRMASDRAEANALFRRAAEAKPPLAYGYFALSYDALCMGKFEEALDLARQAQRIKPGDPTFEGVDAAALEALGRYDELLDENREAQRKNGANSDLAAAEVHWLSCKGLYPQALAAGERFLATLDKKAAAQEIAQEREYYAAMVDYAKGDMQGYSRHVIASGRGGLYHFQAAFASERFGDAENALDGLKASRPYERLLLYLASARAKDGAEEKRRLGAAISQLEKGEKEGRKLAGWLSGKEAVTPAQAAGLHLLPEDKCIALCALAARFPVDREAYLALARPFNCGKSFPHWFLETCLKTK
jgi:hypothetical protein